MITIQSYRNILIIITIIIMLMLIMIIIIVIPTITITLIIKLELTVRILGIMCMTKRTNSCLDNPDTNLQSYYVTVQPDSTTCKETPLQDYPSPT